MAFDAMEPVQIPLISASMFILTADVAIQLPW